MDKVENVKRLKVFRMRILKEIILMKISDIEKLGLYMPAEFGRHHGTIMIWPKRPGSWKKIKLK